MLLTRFRRQNCGLLRSGAPRNLKKTRVAAKFSKDQFERSWRIAVLQTQLSCPLLPRLRVALVDVHKGLQASQLLWLALLQRRA